MHAKFKSIFIANLAEIAKDVTATMEQTEKDQEIFEDHAFCDRFIYSDQDHRVLITPLPLDANFVKETKTVMNYQNLLTLYPVKITESICASILHDQSLLKQLIQIIQNSPGIKISSYAATQEFCQLVDYLRKQQLHFNTPEMPDTTKLWTQVFGDSKAGFRQIALKLDKNFPPLPRGYICSRNDEIIGWATQLIADGAAGVVLKTNRGLAGAGLKIILREDISFKNPHADVAKIISGDRIWQQKPIIVEEYIPPDLNICGGAPNIELRLDNHSVNPLYVCSMRILPDGVFAGVELGLQTVPSALTDQLYQAGYALGKYLQQLGYRGYYELDFVLGKKQRLYAIEANLRRTGGTHVYELAKKLLGQNFMNFYHLISMSKIDAPKFTGWNYPAVKNQLSHLLFSIKGKKEGVLITSINYLKRGKLGYIVIGQNKKQARQIEQKLLKVIN